MVKAGAMHQALIAQKTLPVPLGLLRDHFRRAETKRTINHERFELYLLSVCYLRHCWRPFYRYQPQSGTLGALVDPVISIVSRSFCAAGRRVCRFW